jgi:hypothetical protein
MEERNSLLDANPELQKLLKRKEKLDMRKLVEKKEAKRLADEAAAAKLLADQDAAKKSGELEAFEKTLRSQYDGELAAKDKALQARSERILTSEKKSAIASLSNLWLDDCAADASKLVSMLVRTEFDGDDVATKYIDADGNVITTDSKQFEKYLSEHAVFSRMMKATAATGGGANGGKFRGGATNFASMTLTEKAKLANENPALYAQLSGKK